VNKHNQRLPLRITGKIRTGKPEGKSVGEWFSVNEGHLKYKAL